MDSIRASEAPDPGSIPGEATIIKGNSLNLLTAIWLYNEPPSTKIESVVISCTNVLPPMQASILEKASFPSL